MPEFLGMVVLYHPDAGVVDRVQTYIDEISELLVIDNSETPTPVAVALEQSSPKVRTIRNNANLGIASALNQGVSFGMAGGYKWLLTMDQDSHFAPGALGKMKAFLSSARTAPGILSPFHHTPGGRLPTDGNLTREVGIAMTSGNLLNLEAARVCGPFEEKLFIDSVDHEYCLRLRKSRFAIIRLNEAVLEHNQGDVRFHNFLFLKFKTTNHSSIRKYYMTRNRLYVVRKYLTFDGHFAWRETSELFKAFWAVVFFEADKWKKIKAMLNGAWDFVRGRYGKR